MLNGSNSSMSSGSLSPDEDDKKGSEGKDPKHYFKSEDENEDLNKTYDENEEDYDDKTEDQSPIETVNLNTFNKNVPGLCKNVINQIILVPLFFVDD